LGVPSHHVFNFRCIGGRTHYNPRRLGSNGILPTELNGGGYRTIGNVIIPIVVVGEASYRLAGRRPRYTMPPQHDQAARWIGAGIPCF
jgi:hypothetical protein